MTVFLKKIAYRVGFLHWKFRYYYWKLTGFHYLWGLVNFVREPWFNPKETYTEIFRTGIVNER